MATNSPGKSDREGIGLVSLLRLFPDDDAARAWFEAQIWPDGPHCPHCGSLNVQSGIKHRTMTHRCRDCSNRPMFSLKTGTVMQGSNLGYQTWAIAIYLVTTSLKGVSSLKLHRDLEITQKTAWTLAHRIRKSFERDPVISTGSIEADEAYFGGLEKNKHAKNRLRAGRGTVGKTAVAGIKDRDSKRVSARVVASTDRATLQEFLAEHAAPEATVYTDEASAYKGMPYAHEAVKHSVGEYVRDQAHTNGLESFWALMRRGFTGSYHKMSPKHLQRYVDEFSGRHNSRNADTIDQMTAIVKGMTGKRLRYADLIADNGLASGARTK